MLCYGPFKWKGIFEGRLFVFSKADFFNHFKITEWVLIINEFSNFCLNNILVNGKSCKGCGSIKVKEFIVWCQLPFDVFKFNVNGVARGKPGPTGNTS